MITFKAKNSHRDIINSGVSAFQFPAGEKHIKQDPHRPVEPTEIAIVQFEPDSMHDDLFQLSMWNNFMRNHSDEPERILIMPYLPGARADRGTPKGAEVYAEFIGNMGLDDVYILDPHSETIVEELAIHDTFVETFTASELLSNHVSLSTYKFDQYAGIIAPDKGAVGRAGDVAEALEIPLFKATKNRDFDTGKLTFGSIEELPEEGKLLVVDDICDGGGTFLALGNALEKSGVWRDRLSLYVSHGVFSGSALTNLPYYFNSIYTTNSFNPQRTLNDPRTAPRDSAPFRRLDIIRLMLEEV